MWQDVLPVSIYCKAMGNLLNTAISEIIAKIMMLEVCLESFFIFFIDVGPVLDRYKRYYLKISCLFYKDEKVCPDLIFLK